MENKFSLRDFLVYLLTGFSPIVFYIPSHYEEIIQIVKTHQGSFKDFSAFLLAFCLLALYLIGHLIQSIDLLRYMIARKMLDSGVNIRNRFTKLIFVLLASNRVLGIVTEQKDEKREDFQKKVYYLQINGKFSNSEYWYSLKDLFHGLEVVATFFSIWAFWQEKYVFGGLYLLTIVAFWFEARFYSKEYVESVKYAYEVSKSESSK